MSTGTPDPGTPPKPHRGASHGRGYSYLRPVWLVALLGLLVSVAVVARLMVGDGSPAETDSGRASRTEQPSPSEVERPSPSPMATAVPTPHPDLTPVVGYGAATTGGQGGAVYLVSSAGELEEALTAEGRRTILFDVGAGGATFTTAAISVLSGGLTIDGSTAAGPVTIRGFVRIMASEVIIQNVRFRPGDRVDGNPDDIDGLTINGRNTPIRNIVLNHVSMSWGPDIGGLAILGDVEDVTVQYSIMGPGLRQSAHSDGTASSGHAYAANVAEQSDGYARRVTFYRNLFTTSDKRGPAVQGAECVDVVENTHYNFGSNAANGNPRSINVVNDWFRSGPLRNSTNLWTTQESKDGGSRENSIFMSGNRADGFTGTVDGPDTAFAASVQCGGLSVPLATAEDGYAAVLARAGAILPLRDAVDRALIADVRNRTGGWWNGEGYDAPNPYWPY